jgi:hypothetical protein
MPSNTEEPAGPAALAGRVRSALESGDLDAIRGLLDRNARWGALEGPGDGDCRNRDQDVSGPPAAAEAGGTVRRWQVLTVKGDRITDIRGFDDRTEAAARAGVPA